MNESFNNTGLRTLETHLRHIGQTWGRERGGVGFWLLFFVIPLALCGVAIYLVFTYTPLSQSPLMRIWAGGGIMLLAPAYWVLESYIIRRHWFAILRTRSSVELRMWHGTMIGLQRDGSENGHLAVRTDHINRRYRVRSEDASANRFQTHYLESFPDMATLKQAIDAAWRQNAFLYVYHKE